MQGTCLVSMVKAPATVDGTYGPQSVIGGPGGGGAFTGGFANTKAVMKNLSVWCPVMTNQYGYDFRYLGGAAIEKCSAQAFTSVLGNSPSLSSLPSTAFFQSRISVGLYMPVAGNNADCIVDAFSAEGFSIGIGASDTLHASKIETVYCNFGLYIDATLGLSNNMASIVIDNFCPGECGAGLHVNGGGFVPVYINMASEGIITAQVQDSSNALRGVIHWNDTGDLGTTPPAITGGSNLKVINDGLGPGHWASAPSIPTSGTAQQNISWRDAIVFVSGGTVSQIAIDGQNTGLTSGMFIVPSGKNITITYSAAPTWNWVLL